MTMKRPDVALQRVTAKLEAEAIADNYQLAKRIQEQAKGVRVILIVQKDMLGQRFADVNQVVMMQQLDTFKEIVKRIGGEVIMFTESSSMNATAGINLLNMFPESNPELDRFDGWSLNQYLSTEEASAMHTSLPDSIVARTHIQKTGMSSNDITPGRFNPIGGNHNGAKVKLLPLLLTYDPQFGSRMLRMGYRYLLYPNKEMPPTSSGIIPTMNPNLGSVYSVGIILKTMASHLFPPGSED